MSANQDVKSKFLVDLTNCDREPIHIPGSVQSHGFLVVLDVEGIIRFLSDNIASFIKGASAALIGQPVTKIGSLLGTNTDQRESIIQTIYSGKSNSDINHNNPYQIEIEGATYFVIISTAGEYYLLEFEPPISDFRLDVQKMVSRSISELLADKTLHNLVHNTAVQVKSITNYDRVMIYRFAASGNGEVVAEAKNENLIPWLGLHYPASDIPKQARELYKLNLTRLIANVRTVPAKILGEPGNTRSLDLTNAQLRAVSPIHIQYLKNMGVVSSFSISLLYKDELWGLIACHNYTPKFVDFKSRESAKLIGQILSSALEFRQDAENQQIHDTYKGNLDKLSKYLHESANLEDALMRQPVTLLDVVHATGAVLVYDKRSVNVGIIPAEREIEAIVGWAKEHSNDMVYSTSRLAEDLPEALAYQDKASGLLLLVLSKELEEYVIWFKPEFKQTIKWAGNPNKPLEVSEDGMLNLSPRYSFVEWSELITGSSEPWIPEEIHSVLQLREEILFAINQKAGAVRVLNDKLQQAYEELDTFSYTISHDLKNPISAIKSYAQILASEQLENERSQKILSRIVERADKMNFMINEVLDYSRIGRSELQYRPIHTAALIKDIIKDLDQVYDTRFLKITLGELPDLEGDPIMMLQVFSNLISNAVKYSQLANPALVHIEGSVTNEENCYTIKDNGLGIAAKDLTKIFELFNRMDNVQDIQGSGVGLAIVKRIVERHRGKIWAESELGKGTTFFVSFNCNGVG